MVFLNNVFRIFPVFSMAVIFRRVVIFTAFIASFSANANLDNFQNDLDYADSIRGKVKEETDKFNPEETFEHYTKNPDQTQYFGGVTQPDDKGLQKEAAIAAPQDQTGGAVISASKTRPVFVVDPASPAMQKSNIIQKDAYNVSRGISDKYVDCKAAKECHTTYIKKTCDEQIRTLTRLCTKTPNVTIVKEPYQETVTLSGSISSRDNYSGTFTVLADGIITSFGVQLHSDNVWRCRNNYSGYLQGVYLSSQYSGCGEGLGDMGYHNDQLNIDVKANVPIVFSFSGGPSYGRWDRSGYRLVIQETLYKKVPQITWQEVCQDVN